MDEEKHWFIDSRYIGIGEEYNDHSKKARSINSQQSIDELKFLNYAHTLLMGLIGSMLEVNQNRPVTGNEKLKRRFLLTAAFIQGITLCEESILNSLYLQAGNLIRQEYECLGLLREIEKGKRQDGKQVNAKHAPWNGSRYYGELSTLAHISDHNILESIIQYNTSWGDFSSTVPQYNLKTTKRLYGFHVAMILDLVIEMRGLYQEMYNFQFSNAEADVLNNVIGILMENEVLRQKSTNQ